MKRLAAALLCCLCLGGCTALPGEERSFALCMGVHVTANGVEVAVQLPNYKGNHEYLVLSAVGEDFDQALTALAAVAPSRLHFGQLRLAVFSHQTAASPMFPGLVAQIAAIPSMRLDAMALLTEDELPALLAALKPHSGVRLSKYLDTLLRSQVETGFLPGTTLAQMRRMETRQSPVLGRVGLRQIDAPQAGLSTGIEQLQAGGEEEAHFGGCGLIGQDGRLHGTLDMRQTQLLSLLLGRTRDVALTWPEAAATLHVVDADVRLGQGEARAEVTCRAVATRGAPAWMQERLEQELTQVLGSVNAASCDALGLRRQEMLRHPLTMGMEAAAWAEELHRMPIQVKVTLLPQA